MARSASARRKTVKAEQRNARRVARPAVADLFCYWVIHGAELSSRPIVSDPPAQTPLAAGSGRWVAQRDLRTNDVLLGADGRQLIVVERSDNPDTLPRLVPPADCLLYWVVAGEDLDSRPALTGLLPARPANAEQGRWLLRRDVRVGDSILGQAGDARRVIRLPENPDDEPVVQPFKYCQVEKVYANGRKPLLRVHFGGHYIRVTANHPWYVKDKGWVASARLQPGDLLMTSDAEWVPVDRVEDLGEIDEVFNLRVADCHTYFVSSPAGGPSVLVHNESPSGNLLAQAQTPPAGAPARPAQAQKAFTPPATHPGYTIYSGFKAIKDYLGFAVKHIKGATSTVNFKHNSIEIGKDQSPEKQDSHEYHELVGYLAQRILGYSEGGLRGPIRDAVYPNGGRVGVAVTGIHNLGLMVEFARLAEIAPNQLSPQYIDQRYATAVFRDPNDSNKKLLLFEPQLKAMKQWMDEAFAGKRNGDTYEYEMRVWDNNSSFDSELVSIKIYLKAANNHIVGGKAYIVFEE